MNNKKLDEFINDLTNVLNNKLVSILLYGSAVDEISQDKSSDINLIVVINDLKAHDLKTVHKALKNWLKTKNPMPVFMDRDEWMNSSDVYPIEYSDIIARHKILYGENIVSLIKIDKNHLRLQCESETKNLLIRLRQSYVYNCENQKAIAELITNSSKSVMAIFRAILRTLDVIAPSDKKEVVALIADKVKIDKEIFLQVIEFRNNPKSINKNEYESVIQTFIDSLHEVLRYVDKLNINN